VTAACVTVFYARKMNFERALNRVKNRCGHRGGEPFSPREKTVARIDNAIPIK